MFVLFLQMFIINTNTWLIYRGSCCSIVWCHMWSRNCLPFSSCCSIFSFMCMFCVSLFVLLSLLFWTLCCLFFFDLRLLITSFESTNFSYIILNDCWFWNSRYFMRPIEWIRFVINTCWQIDYLDNGF